MNSTRLVFWFLSALTYCLLPRPGLIVYSLAIILHLRIDPLIDVILLSLFPSYLYWFSDCHTPLYIINLLLGLKSFALLSSNLRWLIDFCTFSHRINLLSVAISPTFWNNILLGVTLSALIIYCLILFYFVHHFSLNIKPWWLNLETMSLDCLLSSLPLRKTIKNGLEKYNILLSP